MIRRQRQRRATDHFERRTRRARASRRMAWKRVVIKAARRDRFPPSRPSANAAVAPGARASATALRAIGRRTRNIAPASKDPLRLTSVSDPRRTFVLLLSTLSYHSSAAFLDLGFEPEQEAGESEGPDQPFVDGKRTKAGRPSQQQGFDR